jgi:uncharacterized protein YoxC
MSKQNKKLSLEEFTNNLHTFNNDLDTTLKATLYSLMCGEIETAKEDVKRIRRRLAAFLNQSTFILSDIQLKQAALNQKVSSLEAYNLHLHRENNTLREQVNRLKKECEFKDLSTNMFDDDMDGSDAKGNQSQENSSPRDIDETEDRKSIDYTATQIADSN